MADHKYQVLPAEDDESTTGSSTFSSDARNRKEYYTKKRQILWFCVLIGLLLLSGMLNVFAFLTCKESRVRYAHRSAIGLESEKDVFFDRWAADADEKEWKRPRYDPYAGMIAVDDDYVRAHNLLPSQRWPWDHSKSMYLLSAWHSMHCLHVIRDVLNQAENNVKGHFSLHHAKHCLYSLREDVICYADDTPLYTGALNAEKGHIPASPGIGQSRKCRDWDGLLEFVNVNSACYDPSKPPHNASIEERYKRCPGGKRPWEEE